MNGPARSRDQAFPLVALFQLATTLAAALACIDFRALAQATEDSQVFLGLAWKPLYVGLPVAAVVGLGLGAVVGAGRLRAARGAFRGGIWGACCGAVVAAVFVAPAPLPRGLGAAVVLLVTTLALRYRTA